MGPRETDHQRLIQSLPRARIHNLSEHGMPGGKAGSGSLLGVEGLVHDCKGLRPAETDDGRHHRTPSMAASIRTRFGNRRSNSANLPVRSLRISNRLGNRYACRHAEARIQGPIHGLNFSNVFFRWTFWNVPVAAAGCGSLQRFTARRRFAKFSIVLAFLGDLRRLRQHPSNGFQKPSEFPGCRPQAR